MNRGSSLLRNTGVEFETQRAALRIRGIDLGPPPEPVRQLREEELERLRSGVLRLTEELRSVAL